jgi:hypothetical protein
MRSTLRGGASRRCSSSQRKLGSMLLLLVIPAKAGIQGLFTLWRSSLSCDALRRCPSSGESWEPFDPAFAPLRCSSSQRKLGSTCSCLKNAIQSFRPALDGRKLWMFAFHRRPGKHETSLDPAFAGMTSKGNSTMGPAFAGMTGNGEAHRNQMVRGGSVKSPWIPAFAGMTSESHSNMDPGFRRNGQPRRQGPWQRQTQRTRRGHHRDIATPRVAPLTPSTHETPRPSSDGPASSPARNRSRVRAGSRTALPSRRLRPPP